MPKIRLLQLSNTTSRNTAMDSPVSAVVVNLYMKFFKELAHTNSSPKAKVLGYVDSTCCIVKKVRKQELLDHQNNIWPSIEFTMELDGMDH